MMLLLDAGSYDFISPFVTLMQYIPKLLIRCQVKISYHHGITYFNHTHEQEPMRAFSHTLFIDTPIPSDTDKGLYFKKDTTLPDRLEHIIEYHQNQNRDVHLSTNDTFEYNHPGQQWLFTVNEVITFQWQSQHSTIRYKLHTQGNDALMQYWLLHTFLPLYLCIERRFELIHGAGVTINDKAVLFIAPSYAGKSTLTNFFIEQGHPMLSDDRLGLYEKEGGIQVVPSYPFHRPYRKMEDLGQPVRSFVNDEKSLHVIYVLKPAEPDHPVAFEPLSGIDKFTALQENFDFDLPLNKPATFELIGQISALVPVYRVYIPRNLAILSKVYEAICAHSESV